MGRLSVFVESYNGSGGFRGLGPGASGRWGLRA